MQKIVYHPDEMLDVAAFRCKGLHAPEIPLDAQADVLAENEFLLEDVTVFGYPPIPFAKAPYLVCLPACVSAVIDHYSVKRRHFVISGMARGGFSGGPAILYAPPHATLGVVTHALLKDTMPTELGFMSVISAGAIVSMLESHDVKGWKKANRTEG